MNFQGKILSIIIPTYNSETKVGELIDHMKKLSLGELKKEIIVVDDCSKDKTYEVCKKIDGITLIHHTKNTGKGGAVKTGLEQATGDILIIQDDDLEYDPSDIPKLIHPILEGKAEVVFGSRRLNKNNKYSSNFYYFGGKFIDSLISLVLKMKLTDAISGSKVFTREVYEKIKPITSQGFEIEAEITAKVIKAKHKPLEIPIRYSPRSVEEGKNIRWHHAIPILKKLIYCTYIDKSTPEELS